MMSRYLYTSKVYITVTESGKNLYANFNQAIDQWLGETIEKFFIIWNCALEKWGLNRPLTRSNELIMASPYIQQKSVMFTNTVYL